MLKRFHLVFDIALNSFVSNIALVHLFYSLSYFLVLLIYLFIYCLRLSNNPIIYIFSFYFLSFRICHTYMLENQQIFVSFSDMIFL